MVSIGEHLLPLRFLNALPLLAFPFSLRPLHTRLWCPCQYKSGSYCIKLTGFVSFDMGIRSRKSDISLDRGLQFRRFATHGLHYIISYASPTHTSSVYSLRVSESNVFILVWVGMQPQNFIQFTLQNTAMILAQS